jgi:hypothetical protein
MDSFRKNRHSPLVEDNSDNGDAADSLLTSKPNIHKWSKPSIFHRTPIWTILNLVLFLFSMSLFGSWWYQTHHVRNAPFREVAGYSKYEAIETICLHDLTVFYL